MSLWVWAVATVSDIFDWNIFYSFTDFDAIIACAAVSIVYNSLVFDDISTVFVLTNFTTESGLYLQLVQFVSVNTIGIFAYGTFINVVAVVTSDTLIKNCLWCHLTSAFNTVTSIFLFMDKCFIYVLFVANFTVSYDDLASLNDVSVCEYIVSSKNISNSYGVYFSAVAVFSHFCLV